MKKFLTYTLLGVLLAGCAGSGREPLETVVDKALAGAERQTLLMAEKYSAREGRLPRTWENGEDVSSDSRWWCSGFFPGVLWYVYENGRNPRVLEYARSHPELLDRLVESGRLPIHELAVGSGVDKKTLERHRKYLVAILLAFTNGYEIIRGHLCQLAPAKGGGAK